MNQVPNGSRAGARVLVVEDNADAAQSLAKLLEIYGYDVQIAADGPQALASTALSRPTIVLLDLGLPGMTATRSPCGSGTRDRARMP